MAFRKNINIFTAPLFYSLQFFSLACRPMQWIMWIIAILFSAAAGYWVFLADKRRAVPYPWLTSLLRSLVVFFTLLLILAPTIVITRNVTEKPIVLFLQDNSRSIGNALGADTAAYRKNAEELLGRLTAKYRVVRWGFGNTIQSDSLFQYRQQATDIAAVLARAQEFYGMQNLGAVILATDGRFNQGANPLYQQLSLHSALYTVGIGDSTRQKDLRISQAYANKTVAINSSFEVRADVVAELCKGYDNSVMIKEGSDMLASVPLTVSSDKFDRSVSFTIKAAHAGLHHYTITVPEAEGEKNTANNRKDIFVEVVEEKKNILIVSAAPHPDVNAIKDALSGMENYKVTVVTADNIPASLSGYNVIIAHGLPSQRNNIAPQLLAAKKPVWFILSNQLSVPNFNTLQPITHFNLTMAPPHDAGGAYNAGFNTFILPPQIQSVTDKMPPLTLCVGNITLLPGISPLFTQRPGSDAGQQPLWFLEQGSVPVAVVTGEGLWRWRLHEYKNFNSHTVIDECIRQTVSFLTANNNEKPFSVVLPRYVWSDQEAVSLNAYLLNANNEQINTPDVQLTITDSGGRKQNFSFERSGNTYNLNIGMWAGGTYTYAAHTTNGDKTYTASGSFVVESMPLEFMEPGADYPLLYSLAKKYSGSLIPAKNISSVYDSIVNNEHVKPLIVTNTETEPLVERKWYFLIILVIATTEWLLRKYWLAQ